MTVKELISELKQYQGDKKVFLITDFDKIDENGNFEEVMEVSAVAEQVFYDDQFNLEDYVEIIIL